MDINTKKLKKNAFRITKERGITASRVRVPGGHLDAELLGKIQEVKSKMQSPIVDTYSSNKESVESLTEASTIQEAPQTRIHLTSYLMI